MNIRRIIGSTAGAVMLSVILGFQPSWASSDAPVIKVFKSPSCGCCKNWVDQARAAGFKVEVTNTENMDMVKKQASIPEHLQSCHTASVDGYVVEGHVPFEDIKRLLKTRPKARGLAVPGMVTGSPGMEFGSERDAFNVVLFGVSGSEKIFQSYPAK